MAKIKFNSIYNTELPDRLMNMLNDLSSSAWNMVENLPEFQNYDMISGGKELIKEVFMMAFRSGMMTSMKIYADAERNKDNEELSDIKKQLQKNTLKPKSNKSK